MGISELNRMMSTRPHPDTLHRLLGSLCSAILEQPADTNRPLVDATYSVWYLGDDNLCRHLLENLAACPLTPSEQSQIEVLLATRHWIDGQIPKMHQLLQKTSASCPHNRKRGKSPSSNPLAAISFTF